MCGIRVTAAISGIKEKGDRVRLRGETYTDGKRFRDIAPDRLKVSNVPRASSRDKFGLETFDSCHDCIFLTSF